MSTSKKPRTKTDAYPYVSYKTFESFVDNLVRRGVPSIIDRTVMPDLNGFNQGLVLATLRFMNLIDANGKTRPSLKQLEKGWKNNRPRVLGTILRSAYPALLLSEDFNLQNAKPARFDARFGSIANPDVARKAKTFFLRAAADAGIPISPRIQPSLRGTRRRPASAAGVNNGTHPSVPSSVELKTQDFSPLTLYQRELQQMREDFPVFNDQWPTEEKVEWYKRRFELLDRIRESTPPSSQVKVATSDTRGERVSGDIRDDNT